MLITVNGEAIQAPESTLNLIAIYAADAAEKYEREGLNGLAKQAHSIACEIHNVLEAVGYYFF